MCSPERIRVLIVEDQKLARERLEAYVRESEAYSLSGSLSNAAMAELWCMSHSVQLVLMDVCTAFDESGLDAAKVLKKRFPGMKIIIITSMPECSFIERAKEAGADSFWYKDAAVEELLTVMDKTMKGEHIFPDQSQEIQIGLAKSSEFTKQELKVLRLLVEGFEYRDIGEQLGITERTVRYHVTNMLQKTGYKNRLRLAIAASNKHFIIPSNEI